MKIFINDIIELNNIGSIIEKTQKNNDSALNVLAIKINDSQKPIDEIEKLFQNIHSIKVERTDLNDEIQTLIFTKYLTLQSVDRKISDETDVTTVTLE